MFSSLILSTMLFYSNYHLQGKAECKWREYYRSPYDISPSMFGSCENKEGGKFSIVAQDKDAKWILRELRKGRKVEVRIKGDRIKFYSYRKKGL